MARVVLCLWLTLHHSKRDMNAPFTGLAIQKKRTNLSPGNVPTYYNVTIDQCDNDTVIMIQYIEMPPGAKGVTSY